MSFRLRSVGMITAVGAIALSGCGKLSGYRPVVSDFQNATAVVIESSKTQFVEINKDTRNQYIDRQVQRAIVHVSGAKNAATAAENGWIDEDSIIEHEPLGAFALAARLDALNNLARYTDLLNSLANSDAPDRIKQKSEDLGASLAALNGSLKDAGVLNGPQGTAFGESVKAFTGVFGLIAKSIVESKISDALDKAVNQADPKVRKLIAVIRLELHDVIAIKRRKLKDEYSDALKSYNDFIDKNVNNPDGILAAAEEIKAKLNQLEAFESVSSDSALDSMASAHEALVNYAKSGKNATDLASLASAMDSFTSQAKILADAIAHARKASEALDEIDKKKPKKPK